MEIEENMLTATSRILAREASGNDACRSDLPVSTTISVLLRLLQDGHSTILPLDTMSPH